MVSVTTPQVLNATISYLLVPGFKFNVDVKSVNTLIQKGKQKRFRGKLGRRVSIKKAFVKLADGQTIDTSVEIK